MSMRRIAILGSTGPERVPVTALPDLDAVEGCDRVARDAARAITDRLRQGSAA